VVIPFEYHRGQWERCIGAWMAQTVEPLRYEVILVVPPGFPRQQELTDFLSRTNSRCRLLECDLHHDIGLSAFGASAARGQLLFFTESHCWPEPDVLALCVRAFDEHPEWAGFSCRSLPITPNRMAEAEADMYEADITYGMTVHPWRKILDQCFVTRRDAYTQCGGLQEEYGHFGEWALAASYHELGLVIGYLPEARFHHHYIGVLSELRKFTLDFVRGEINFLSGDLSRPGRHLIEIPEEWMRRGSHDRQLARALLRISLRECWRDVVRLPGHLSAAMRWLAPALLGDSLGRTGALINVMSSHVAARLANLFGSKQKLSEAFKAYLAALIHRQRLSSMADVRAAKRYDPDRSIFSPDHAGFHPIETYQGERFRWSETAAMLRIDLPAGQIGICIDCLPVRGMLANVRPRFYLDGKRIADSDVKLEPFRAVIKANVLYAHVATLGWTCGYFAAPNDQRSLGLPVKNLATDPRHPCAPCPL